MDRSLSWIIAALLLPAFCALQPANADEKKDGATDKQKLQGRWVITHAGAGGFPIHPTKNKKGKSIGGDYPDFIFEGDKFTFVFKGEKLDKPEERMKFKIDPTKNPKHFDHSGLDADGKESWTLGIYKFEGDTLTICWQSDKKRPTGFKIGEQEKDARLFIMVRQKPKK